MNILFFSGLFMNTKIAIFCICLFQAVLAQADEPLPSSEITTLSERSILDSAIAIASETCKNLKISIDGEIESDFLLKTALPDGTEYRIDVVSVKDRSPSELAKEILRRIDLQQKAWKTPGILISASGSKFDTRLLQKHTARIDSDGYLCINDHRIIYNDGSETGKLVILPAEVLRSEEIFRLVEVDQDLYLTDLPSRIREGQAGMRIVCQEKTSSSGETFYILDRPPLSPETISRFVEILREVSAP